MERFSLVTTYQFWPLHVANKGQTVQNTLSNRLPTSSAANRHDEPLPRCPALNYNGEVSMHVHLVKFDALAADGSSTGW